MEKEQKSKTFRVRIPEALLSQYSRLNIQQKHALNEAIRQLIQEFVNSTPEQSKRITVIFKSEKLEGLERMIQLIQKLYFFREPCPPLQRQVIADLFNEAKKLISD